MSQSENVSTQQIAKDIKDMKEVLSQLHVPKQFEFISEKVGQVERSVKYVERGVNQCYDIVFFLFIVLVLFVFSVCYIMWKVNYFEKYMRIMNYSIYTPPRKICGRCYTRDKKPILKKSMSSPSLSTL
jgi:hypothetical protein